MHEVLAAIVEGTLVHGQSAPGIERFFALPPDPGWTDVLYVFHGDPHTGKWTINGEVFPDITIQGVTLGVWSIIELRNISQSAHPFHLHGMAFEVLSVDGEPPPLRRIEDTLDVSAEILIGQKTVPLKTNLETVEFPFTPEDAGRFEFIAAAEPQDGEIVAENNRAMREVNIIDDYLRLMYVAYEPSWEWRFVKEVFHRDKLIGMDGFRIYIASSDPQVRETNVLFLPTLTPKRSDFFANDVIFLNDMARTAINDRFCEMVREFVSQFGGGLVVIGGPRFGPAELHGTPLADMLPVILDPDARLRDDRPFRPQLTSHAARYPFMQLGDNDVENWTAATTFALALLGGNFVGPNPPALLRPLTRLTPNGWALEAFTGLSAGNAGLAGVLPAVGVLVVIGIVTGALGLGRIHRAVAP